MIPLEEKEVMRKKASKDFPQHPMMSDLHFTRELIFALKKREKRKTYLELGEIHYHVATGLNTKFVSHHLWKHYLPLKTHLQSVCRDYQ